MAETKSLCRLKSLLLVNKTKVCPLHLPAPAGVRHGQVPSQPCRWRAANCPQKGVLERPVKLKVILPSASLMPLGCSDAGFACKPTKLPILGATHSFMDKGLQSAGCTGFSSIKTSWRTLPLAIVGTFSSGIFLLTDWISALARLWLEATTIHWQPCLREASAGVKHWQGA